MSKTFLEHMNMYLDIVGKELRKSKPSRGTRVLCCKCKRGGVTLRKYTDGTYICNDCLKEEKECQQ